METSPEIKNIAPALVKFRTKPIFLAKNGTNPHFRSKFATLNDTIESMEPALVACGLTFVQLPDGDGLTTIIIHESGEWIKATATLNLDKQTPQGQGSAITYMRRYALSAAFGITTEDDDDGNEASKPTQPHQAALQRTKTAKPIEVEGPFGSGQVRTVMPAKDPAVELLAQKDRVVSLLKQLGFKPVGKTVAEKRAEVEEAVFKHANAELTDTNLEAIAEILSAKIEQLEAVADQ
jgi:hypothetical protein